MKTNLKIFYGLSIFAIIAVANIAHAATTSVVSNKTSQFNDVLSEMGANATDSSNAALAETIRRQRALLDAAGDTATTGGTNITTANACDAALRKCMSEKCGADFTKCASDSTTIWGNKMDACRRNTKCTGHEYTLLAPEILADRNAAIELSYYNSVVNCGNRYNNCVFGICGKSLENCLSKSAGDSAITKCKSIADECREQDSGLAARVMGVFGDRRNIAATEAQKQEKRLYELRDLMRTQCTRFGAMFDERTLDCVYTVNFFAGADNTLMASKKLYSGDTFQCTPDWFGVDITTYMENAARLTRSQTSASAAAMGAGLGTAASLWTSGAVMRGIDTQNAEKQAKEKCTAVGGEWVSAGFNQGSKCDMRKPKADCERQGYIWNDETGCPKQDDDGQSSGFYSSNGNLTPANEIACNNLPEPQCKKPCEWKKGKCSYTENSDTTDLSNGGDRNSGAYDAANGADGVNTGNNNVINPFCGKLITSNNEPAKKAGIECTKDGKQYYPEPEDMLARNDYGARTDDNGKYCFTESVPSGATCIISYLTYPRLSGTIEQLNQNKNITLCDGTRNQTIPIGTNCNKTDSSTRGGSNPENVPSSTETEKEEEEDKNVDCSKYNKPKCQLLYARKCWWNGDNCVDASEKPETVDINGLTVTSSYGDYGLTATIQCGSRARKQTIQADKTITLKKVPLNETCTITANGCDDKTINTEELAKKPKINLTCKYIDNCLSSGGVLPEKKDPNNNVSCTCTNKTYDTTTQKCVHKVSKGTNAGTDGHMYTKNGYDINSDENTEDDTYNPSGHRMSTKPNDTQQNNGSNANPSKNSETTCNTECTNALNSLRKDVNEKKTSKNWWYAVTSKRLTNTECANQCVKKADDICKQLVDSTIYTDDDTGNQYKITSVSAKRQDLAPHGTDVYAHNIACEPNYVKLNGSTKPTQSTPSDKSNKGKEKQPKQQGTKKTSDTPNNKIELVNDICIGADTPQQYTFLLCDFNGKYYLEKNKKKLPNITIINPGYNPNTKEFCIDQVPNGACCYVRDRNVPDSRYMLLVDKNSKEYKNYKVASGKCGWKDSFNELF